MKQAPVLTERDMKRVLQYVTRTAYPARNRCLLMLSWLAGMRVGEIAALSVEDVVTPDGEIRPDIQLRPDQTRGSSARTVLVGSRLRSELDASIRARCIKPAPEEPADCRIRQKQARVAPQ